MLGKQIKKIRQDAGLTQEEFGKKIFHTKSTVSKWENGNQTPDLPTLKKISTTFNIKLDSLLQDVEDKSPREKDLVHRARIKSANYNGIKNKERIKRYRYMKYIFSSLAVILFLLPLIIFISKSDTPPHYWDDYKPAFYAMGGLSTVSFILFIYSMVQDGKTHLWLRYNVVIDLYNSMIRITNEETGNSKDVRRKDIKKVEFIGKTNDLQVNIDLVSGKKIIIFGADSSVKELVASITKGETNE